MERLQNAIASLCPHLKIKIRDSKVLNTEEIVFLFSSEEQIEPLYEMLKKYDIHVEIDIVQNVKFLFVYI